MVEINLCQKQVAKAKPLLIVLAIIFTVHWAFYESIKSKINLFDPKGPELSPIDPNIIAYIREHHILAPPSPETPRNVKLPPHNPDVDVKLPIMKTLEGIVK
jgi:hypothetical protein